MLPLLKNVEAISSCRDRDKLLRALLRAVVTLCGNEADAGILSRELQGETVLRMFSGTTPAHSVVSVWGEFLEEAEADGKLVTRRIHDRNYGIFILQNSELATEQIILAYGSKQANTVEHAEMIACLARIYGSQIRLLDYSELDTLTRLLNRKTFDETFDRLLSSPSGDGGGDRFEDRRDCLEKASPAWLCVVDVDHFKRVNDLFGHLFGDEVLLRMGDLMRKTFRGGDRLFRFGGEEFVVILNAENENLAAVSFNRFRRSVEKYEFPRVGKVTCSIGFTLVSSMDVPTDVVGRADEALYYAKKQGRNQVCCYERLVAEGAITKPVAIEAPIADGFDIDALFA